MILPQLSEKNRVALFKVMTELQSPTLSLDDLIGYVERSRGKSKGLRIETDTMPPGMAGYAVSLRDCDLIGLNPVLSPSQRLGTTLHEIAHFIRDDIPLLPYGQKTITYDVFIQRRDKYEGVTSKRFFNYDDPVERDTEMLSRIFMEYIHSQEQVLPEIFIDLMS